MVQIEITKENQPITYELPTSWDDISVETFAEMYSINIEGLHPINVSVKYVSVLSGISEEDLFEMSTDEFALISEQLNFMDTEINKQHVEQLEIDGVTYYVKDDFKKLTFGEQASLEIMLDKANFDLMKCMPEMLCVFLRQKDEEGKLEKFTNDCLNRTDIFKKAKIADVHNLFTFFLDTSSLSNTTIETYSEQEVKKMVKKLRNQ